MQNAIVEVNKDLSLLNFDVAALVDYCCTLFLQVEDFEGAEQCKRYMLRLLMAEPDFMLIDYAMAMAKDFFSSEISEQGEPLLVRSIELHVDIGISNDDDIDYKLDLLRTYVDNDLGDTERMAPAFEKLDQLRNQDDEEEDARKIAHELKQIADENEKSRHPFWRLFRILVGHLSSDKVPA